MAFLELTGSRSASATSVAVEDFNLAAERGEFVSFLGPSGCGKTTTLRMIAGLRAARRRARSSSTARDITDRPPNRRNVGMVFQSYALFPNMTVARQHRLRAEGPASGRSDKIKQAGRRAARADPPARQGRPLPVPALRRPAAARRAGPGPRHRAPGPAPRRAAVRARRQDPGRPAPGDPRDPAPARDHDRLRHPRPGGGAVAVRPGRGDERGPDRADRHARPRSTTSRRRRSWPRSSGTLNLLAAKVVDAGDGPAVASPARKSAPPGRSPRRATGATVTLALRPESIELGRGRRRQPAARAPSRTSASSARSSGSATRLGDSGDDRLARHVQRPEPDARPRSTSSSTVLVPAGGRLVLGAGRRPRSTSSPASDAEALLQLAGSSPLDLDGIDLVVFDKDGTLIDFHAMWGGWALRARARLDGATRRPVARRRVRGDRLRPDDRARRGRRRRWRSRRWPRSRSSSPRSCAAGARASPRPGGPSRRPGSCPTRWRPGRAAGRPRRAVRTAPGRAAGGSRSRRPTTARRPTRPCARSASATSRGAGLRRRRRRGEARPATPLRGLSRASRRSRPSVAIVGDTPADLAMARAAGRRAGRRRRAAGSASAADLEAVADVVLDSVAELRA